MNIKEIKEIQSRRKAAAAIGWAGLTKALLTSIFCSINLC